MSFSAMCVCELVRVLSLLALCACDPLCECVRACMRACVASDLVCLCFCHALYENVNFHMFYTLVYLRIVCFPSSSVVKRLSF